MKHLPAIAAGVFGLSAGIAAHFTMDDPHWRLAATVGVGSFVLAYALIMIGAGVLRGMREARSAGSRPKR